MGCLRALDAQVCVTDGAVQNGNMLLILITPYGQLQINLK